MKSQKALLFCTDIDGGVINELRSHLQPHFSIEIELQAQHTSYGKPVYSRASVITGESKSGIPRHLQ